MSSRREKVLVAIVLQTLIATAFAAAQRWNGALPGAPPPWLVTRIDPWVPLVPQSVWLYASWYVAPIVVVLADRANFRRAALAVLLGFLACATGWVAVPVTMPRPTLDGEGGAAMAMLGLVYRMDPPSNLFPSFHATLATIVACVATSMPRVRVVVAAWMAAICLSCVATKQHFVLDVVAGVSIGLATWNGAGRVIAYLDRARSPRAMRHRQTAAPMSSPSAANHPRSGEPGVSVR